MTTEFVRFDLAGGGSVLVEVKMNLALLKLHDEKKYSRMPSCPSRAQSPAFGDAASSALGQFQAMSRRPDEVEIKFGVKLDAKAGAVIAQSGMQGHFEVKLRWHRESSMENSPPVEEQP